MIRLLFGVLLAAVFHIGMARAQTHMVAESRSIVSPGLWWNELRNGNGFDVYPIGSNLFLVWYTYTSTGKAIWYSATAAPQADGTYRGDWLLHGWQNGSVATSTPVGSAQVTISNAEQINLRFTLHGQTGNWLLTRYRFSAAMGEVDRSGLWWDEARPGFALSLAEFFDATLAVMYAYNTAGEPTWMLGSRQGKGSRLELVEYQGACPTCVYRGSTEVGRANLDYESVHGAGGSGGLAARISGDPLGSEFRVNSSLKLFTPSHREADLQLVPFRDPDNLRRYLAYGAAYLRQPFSAVILPSPAPPQLTSAFSTTNNQENRVEEPNLLVSDGTMAYGKSLGSGQISVAQLTPDSIVTKGVVRSRQQRSNFGVGGLLLHGDLVVNVESPSVTVTGGLDPVWLSTSSWTRGTTSIDVFRREASGELIRQFWMDLDGFLLSARRVGDQLIVVSRAARAVHTILPNAGYLAPATAYQRLLELPVADLLPAVLVRDRREALQNDQLYLPPQGLEVPQNDFILLTRINLRNLGDRETIGILGTASAVYVSESSVYVATSRTDRHENAGLPAASFLFRLTDIHKVAFSDGRLKVQGSVTVEGSLDRFGDKAAFRFSEHEGVLRVVTTSARQWGALGQNRVSIVRPSPLRAGTFSTVSVLPNRQRTAPIGKPNEVLFGTRFVGDKLYAITFKRTDPLYVIDMSQLDDPVVAGQIELPGFSDYLHPLPNRLLLGIGLSAVDAGNAQGDAGFAWYQGVLITLFDVFDINRPRVLQQLELGKRGSSVEVMNHHHGLSVLPRENGWYDFAMPVSIADGPSSPGSPWASLPLVDAGLLRLNVNTQAGASARITSLPMLSTRATGITLSSFGGRAIISPQRSVYFHQGRFWQLDHATASVRGPFQ